MESYIPYIINVILLMLILLGVLMARPLYKSLGAYAGKKGENLATKEDISCITELVKSTELNFSKELEQFKSEISEISQRNQTRYSLLHEKRIEEMEKLYALVIEAQLSVRVAMHLWKEGSTQEPVLDKAYELDKYFKVKRIYFNESLVRLVDEFLDVLFISREYKYFIAFKDSKNLESSKQDFIKNWDSASRKILPIVEELERKISEMLGTVREL